ncbi:MAG: ATP-binding protein, partial [Bacteroidota bacterium]|nr:ATP-binding protein [Bacteroidota bacterium]
MATNSRKKFRRATVIFWFLLLYIIAALLWWLLSLEQQNRAIHQIQRQQVISTQTTSNNHQAALLKINESQRRNSVKFITEGITFLLLILFGAVYIYRLVRREFLVQQQQQNFVMAVTHELKTPISVARLNLETMQKHKLDEEKNNKLLQMTLQETLRLDTLINNILISSQLDVEDYKMLKEELDLSDLLNNSVKQFHQRYSQRKIDLEIEPEIEIYGDPLLINLLISNLLENAQKYSPSNKTITCRLFQKNKKIYLQIIDEGMGIPASEKANIFQKFYRIGNEQTRHSKGTGLGLFISKKIA